MEKRIKRVTPLTPEKKFTYFLLHLHMLTESVKKIIASLGSMKKSNFKEKDSESFDVILISMYHLIIIKYMSFHDEFSEYQSLIPNKTLQKELKKQLSEVYKTWKDTERFRNETLAHAYRRKGDSIFSSQFPVEYDISRNISSLFGD